ELLQSLPAVLAPVERRGLKRTIGEVESVVVGGRRALDVIAPGGVVAPGQMAAVDAMLVRLLSELLRPVDARVQIPAIPFALADGLAPIAIDIGGGEPSRAAALIHVDAVMVIGEFERVAILLRVGLDRGGVLLHVTADDRQGDLEAVQKVRI